MFYLRPILIAVLLALFVPAVEAGSTDEPTFEERLERLVERLEAERQSEHIAGMAIAVVKDDQIVLARGFGMADVEAETPVTPETLFAIGSSTKAFTATLIGMLADDDELDWDDPITEYLPYFTLQIDGDQDDEVTLRDLLSHQTGFTRMGLLWAGGQVTRETILHTATGAEAWSGFREKFYYNNVMFLAAGVASGEAAGTDWDSLLDERIFTPLGMDDSNTSVSRSRKDPRLAMGYKWDEDGEVFEHQTMLDLDSIGPAGAINSNVLDMAEWVRFQLGHGRHEGTHLISAERHAETWEPQIKVGGNVSYGLGWFLREWNGQTVVEHGGNIEGFSAQVALLPESNLGYVLLTNVSFTPLQIGSISVVFDTLLGEVRDESDDSEQNYDEYLGTYIANFASFKDETFTVQIKNNRLAVDVPSQMTFELKEPDEEGKWFFAMTDEIAVSFDRNEEGGVIGMKMYQAGFAFEIPREDVVVEPDALVSGAQRYVGTYRDEKLGDVKVLLKENNRLAVDIPSQMVFELRPPNEEGAWLFRIREGMSVKFNEDEDGNVASMTAFTPDGTHELPRLVSGDERVLPTLAEVFELRGVERRAKALEAVGSLRATGTMRFVNSGLEGELTTVLGGHDRYRTDMDFGPFGKLSVAALRDEGWNINPVRGFEKLDGIRRKQLIQGNPMALMGDWRRFFSSITVERTDDLDGREVIVLSLENEDAPATTYYVDAANGDILKSKTVIVEDPVRVPVTTTYSDFRDVEGVRVAFRITAENEMVGRTVVLIEAYETDLEFPEGHFVLEDPTKQ